MVGSAEGREDVALLEAMSCLGMPSRRLKTSIPVHSNLPATLLRQIFVEERRQFAEVLLRLGRIRVPRILRMRLAFEHVEISDNAGLTQLAMHAPYWTGTGHACPM